MDAVMSGQHGRTDPRWLIWSCVHRKTGGSSCVEKGIQGEENTLSE